MYDEEIEKAVLFYMIIKKEELDVEEEDFINQKNRAIAKAIIKLRKAKEEISILSVKSKIEGNQREILEYISNLGKNIYGITVDSCYNKLKELSKKRKVYELAQKILGEIAEIENIDIYIQDCIDMLNNIEKINAKEKTFKEQVAETASEIERNYLNRNDYSLYTGIFDLDKLTCGLHNQELTIIGARPGMGKTTLTLQIAQNIAKEKNVVFVSLEMSDIQLIQKMIAKHSMINSYKMRLGTLEDSDWNKIAEASVKISDLNLRVNTKIRTIQEIELMAKRLKNKEEIDLLIIDYIQLLKSQGKFNLREQEVAEISRRLKLLSLELNIPIIALCQLNRNANIGEPTLADLRESGSLEQDADNIIFIYKEDEESNLTTLKLAKQRAGDTGKVKVNDTESKKFEWFDVNNLPENMTNHTKKILNKYSYILNDIVLEL